MSLEYQKRELKMGSPNSRVLYMAKRIKLLYKTPCTWQFSGAALCRA